MEWKTPQVFLVAETRIIRDGMDNALKVLGAQDYKSNALSDTEELVEFGGRSCYKSFHPDLNANLTKVRTDAFEYIGNILKQQHGSVLEHGETSIFFANVSRIFTHELVRHRAGCGYSQESLRFVRIEDIGMYQPEVFTPEFLERYVAPYACGHYAYRSWAHMASESMYTAIAQKVFEVEQFIGRCANELGLNNASMPFAIKKKITSALRRLAPDGMTTHILVTANHRAWRHLIGMRTSGAAEEEIRTVFNLVGALLSERYPAIYQDMYPITHDDGTSGWEFKNPKI